MADYTSLSRQELDTLLSAYQLGDPLKISPMSGGQANSSVKITTETGVYILSVCDEKNMDEVVQLTGLLFFLEEHNFRTTRLVRARDGAFQIHHGDKPVYVKRFIPGEVIQSLSRDMVYQVGETMATLHSLPPPEGLGNCFPYGLGSFDEFLQKDYHHPYTTWLTDKKKYLEEAIDPDMEKVLIHGDIFWDNLLFAEGRIAALLDFEEACVYYRLYDLGVCAVGCCSESGRLDIKRLTALIAGYQKHHQLRLAEQAQLRVFMEYAAVAGSFWRFRQYNIRRPDPEKNTNYLELSTLAEQIHKMTNEHVMALFQV